MFNIKSALLGVFASGVLTISGCTMNSVVEKPKPYQPVAVDLSVYEDQYEACPKITKKTVLDCNQQDGLLQKKGRMGCYVCMVSYEDAGKDCQDASDCEGDCRTKQGEFFSTNMTNVVGECSANSSAFGCYQTIEKGVAQSAICMD